MSRQRRRGQSGNDAPSVTLLYHFFHPDDVVSARHFGDMAEELVKRGWDVRVLTSNRFCRYPRRRIPQRTEVWKGVRIYRVRRPGFDQSRNVPRLLNLAWMLGGWSNQVFRHKPGLIVVGTDPQFSQLGFPILKAVSRRSRIAFWCFDLYPEAIIADDPRGWSSAVARRIKPVMKRLYRRVDLMVDLGPCMRRRLDAYDHRARRATLVPWALVEPERISEPDPAVRRELFGDARLGLFYSGNLGKAHRFRPFLELARRVARLDEGIAFCFACRGNRADELKAALKPGDRNIRLAGFAQESELEARLAAADIHLLSLKPEWSGIVVPSKFFGSLAAGRPVLYIGPEDSAVAQWVERFDVGLTVSDDSLDAVARRLVDLARDPDRLRKWQTNAFRTYHERFSKKIVMDAWDELLREQHRKLRGD